MAKGNKRKKSGAKQHGMDTDDAPPQWQSGVSAETGEEFIGMDTGDFADKLKAQAQPMKVKQGKRGNRTRNQKRRRSDKLEKALAFAGKFEGKAGRAGSAKQARKQATKLWGKDDGGGGAATE